MDYKALTAAIIAQRMGLEEQAADGTLDGTKAVACEVLFPEWAAGPYNVGDVCRHGGQIWRCCQAHDSTGQTGWEPAGGALWAPYHTVDARYAKEFIQPTGAHDTYESGEVCRWEGAIYRSKVDANAYSPADYPDHWEIIP